MSFAWLIVLVIYGLGAGWAAIDPLCWWLLVPFFIQDHIDGDLRRR